MFNSSQHFSLCRNAANLGSCVCACVRGLNTFYFSKSQPVYLQIVPLHSLLWPVSAGQQWTVSLVLWSTKNILIQSFYLICLVGFYCCSDPPLPCNYPLFSFSPCISFHQLPPMTTYESFGHLYFCSFLVLWSFFFFYCSFASFQMLTKLAGLHYSYLEMTIGSCLILTAFSLLCLYFLLGINTRGNNSTA